MKRINLYLTESQLQQLAALSDGRPLAEFIRRAIDEFIDKNAPKKKKAPRVKWDDRGNVV